MVCLRDLSLRTRTLVRTSTHQNGVSYNYIINNHMVQGRLRFVIKNAYNSRLKRSSTLGVSYNYPLLTLNITIINNHMVW